jgi:AraC-like DNA-binding protein
MNMTYEERASDSPYIEKIGQFRAESSYSQTCPADVHSNMLLVKLKGKTVMTVWGPETKPGLMSYPKDAEFLFITFKLGTFMPDLPSRNLTDTGTILPEAASQSFWLKGSAWQFPDYENVDTFINRLVHDELLVRDSVVTAALRHEPLDISSRTIQHRFLHATGLSHNSIRQIERAQQAAALLEQGVSILDTVYEAGYFDQPHLTRSLKQWIGQTPAQIARSSKQE